MPGYRQQYKKQKQDLLRRHEESVADKGEGKFGSIINSSKLPKGMGFWKCSDEKHIVDFIPFIAGPDMPKVSGGGIKEGEFTWLVDLWVHWNIGVLQHPYICPARTNGEPCPICEHLQQNKDTYTKEEYNDIKAKHRTVYLIWCHDNSTEKEKGIQLWEVAHFFMEYNLKEIAERPRGGGTVLYFDPDIGKNVVFTRRGKGAGNTEFIGHRFDDRQEPIPDKILDQSFPLDSVIKYATYDELHDAFFGTKHGEDTVGETGEGEAGEPVYGEAPFEQEPEPEPEFAQDECPVNGEFGVDHEQLEGCDGCVNWDNCFAANQVMQEPEPEMEPEPPPQRAQLRTPIREPAVKPAPIKKPPRRR